MTGINVETKTKERFKRLKLDYSARVKEVTEDEFENILLDKFEGKGK